MLKYSKKYLLPKGSRVKDALVMLNDGGLENTIFIVDENNKLIGSLTDGDVRRGLICGSNVDTSVEDIANKNPKFINGKKYSVDQIVFFRNAEFKVIPIVDDLHRVVDVLDFRKRKSFLPLSAVVMAGGIGERLKPLTNDTPKPLLKVGDKPIIDYVIDGLIKFGVNEFFISVCYLGDKIEEYLGDGSSRGVSFKYIYEDFPLGTIGALGLVDEFRNENIVVTNSDLLTNLNFEDFYLSFLNEKSTMSVATIPYSVNVPYGVMETDDKCVRSLLEKPCYTYQCNAGIYMVKNSVRNLIPIGSFYNATDLMQEVINRGYGLNYYSIHGYWLDIGSPQDYADAQNKVGKIIF